MALLVQHLGNDLPGPLDADPVAAHPDMRIFLGLCAHLEPGRPDDAGVCLLPDTLKETFSCLI